MKKSIMILICVIITASMSLAAAADNMPALEKSKLPELDTTTQPTTKLPEIIKLPALDQTSIGAPSELSLVKVEKDLVSLNWKDNSTTETKFVIERRETDGFYTQLAVLGKDVTAYDDKSAEPSTNYCYRVKAGADKPNPITYKFETAYSGYSNELMVETPGSEITLRKPPAGIEPPGDLIQPPKIIDTEAIPETTPGTTEPIEIKAPESLKAEAVKESEIALTWEDKSDNEDGFVLYRTYTGEWEEAAVVSAGVTAYTDKAVTSNTKYYYVLYAYAGETPSKESNIVEVTTPGQAAATATADFTGASSWALEELAKAVEYGLYTDNIMNNYNQSITREEFCELVVKLYEKLKGTAAVPASPNPFSDTANESILKAYGAGIVNGTSQDTFSPDSSITRQDICVMLYRAITKSVSNVDTSIDGVPGFTDENLIGSWAVREVKFAYRNNIMKGSDSKIMPRDNTSREQALLLVKRVYEAFAGR